MTPAGTSTGPIEESPAQAAATDSLDAHIDRLLDDIQQEVQALQSISAQEPGADIGQPQPASSEAGSSTSPESAAAAVPDSEQSPNGNSGVAPESTQSGEPVNELEAALDEVIRDAEARAHDAEPSDGPSDHAVEPDADSAHGAATDGESFAEVQAPGHGGPSAQPESAESAHADAAPEAHAGAGAGDASGVPQARADAVAVAAEIAEDSNTNAHAAESVEGAHAPTQPARNATAASVLATVSPSKVADRTVGALLRVMAWPMRMLPPIGRDLVGWAAIGLVFNGAAFLAMTPFAGADKPATGVHTEGEPHAAGPADDPHTHGGDGLGDHDGHGGHVEAQDDAHDDHH